MTANDLCAYAGLTAVFLATANICLGLLIAVRYSPWRSWPHRRINYFRVHNWTGYLLLLVTFLHPVFLLFVKTARFRPVDIIYPVHSPVQPVENTVGAAALYLLAIVVVSSYFRLGLGRKLWKRTHFLVYAAAACAFVHGILADPELKGSAVDPLDGEKLFVEACFLAVAVGSWLALRYRARRSDQKRARRAPAIASEGALFSED